MISSMTISFSNSSPKMPKSDIFRTKFRHFRFCFKFSKYTNLRVLISNITLIFSEILPQKYPDKAFLVANVAFLFFREILQLDKFESAHFKYRNIVFRLQPKNTQIRHFWSEIRHFYFKVKFCK